MIIAMLVFISIMTLLCIIYYSIIDISIVIFNKCARCPCMVRKSCWLYPFRRKMVASAVTKLVIETHWDQARRVIILTTAASYNKIIWYFTEFAHTIHQSRLPHSSVIFFYLFLFFLIFMFFTANFGPDAPTLVLCPKLCRHSLPASCVNTYIQDSLLRYRIGVLDKPSLLMNYAYLFQSYVRF